MAGVVVAAVADLVAEVVALVDAAAEDPLVAAGWILVSEVGAVVDVVLDVVASVEEEDSKECNNNSFEDSQCTCDVTNVEFKRKNTNNLLLYKAR